MTSLTGCIIFLYIETYPISDLDDFKVIICRILKHGALQGIRADRGGLLRPGLQGHRAGLRSHRGAETYTQGNKYKLPSTRAKLSFKFRVDKGIRVEKGIRLLIQNYERKFWGPQKCGSESVTLMIYKYILPSIRAKSKYLRFKSDRF